MLKLLILVFSSLLLVQPFAIAGETPESQEIEFLAIHHYAKGEYRQAIKLWEDLLKQSPKMEREKIREISILIATAQESIGFPREACSTLSRELTIDPSLCFLDPNQTTPVIPKGFFPQTHHEITMTMMLGNLMRDFGKFKEARQFLNIASQQAEITDYIRLKAGIQLSLADLEFMQLTLQRDRLAYREAKLLPDEASTINSSFAIAYEAYERALDSPLKRDALSKWLSLHETHRKFHDFTEDSQLYQDKAWSYKKFLIDLKDSDLSQETEITKANFQLSLAQHLHEFGVVQQDQAALRQAFEVNRQAIQIGQNINNSTVLSKAYGQAGRLYKLSKQQDSALEAFINAARYAQVNRDIHQLYQWQYEIAKLYEQLNQSRLASSYFDNAIASLKDIEWDVSPLSSPIRQNFQEKAAPIFEDYLSFLLNSDEKDFQKIVQIQTSFKTSELQNYLGCGTLRSISPEKVFEQDQNVALIYVLKSKEQLHILLQNPQGFTYRTVQKGNTTQLLNEIRLLVTSLQDKNSTFLREKLQQLHSLIIEPIEKDLKTEQTLIFSLDSSFEQIPMGMLFDGTQHLIEKHPVALSTSQLFEPQELKTTKETFFAGLSQPQTSTIGEKFVALPFVGLEAKAIQPETQIFNQSFTQKKLIEGLTQYSVVHIASHGQFSSDPNETFLLAWDQKVTLTSLASVVGYRAQNTPHPIDLLVLSACETAKGDRIATIGMAGITVQAGASSTLASLWRSQDQSTAYIMQDFYSFWRSGHTKAKALQLAQIQQIQQGRSPIHWGNFVLVGSWL